MKPTQYLFFITFLIATTGCSIYTLKPMPTETQKIISIAGKNMLVSKKSHIVKLAFPQKNSVGEQQPVYMIIGIQNLSPKKLNFSLNDISAYSHDIGSNLKEPIIIYGKDVLTKDINRYEKNSRNRALMKNLSGGVSHRSYKNSAKRIKTKSNKLKNFVLENQVIKPGLAGGGFFKIKLPQMENKDKKLVFIIKTNGETHEMSYMHKKAWN